MNNDLCKTPGHQWKPAPEQFIYFRCARCGEIKSHADYVIERLERKLNRRQVTESGQWKR